MSPLSAITPPMSSLGLLPQADLVAPARAPEVAAPGTVDSPDQLSQASAPPADSFATMLGRMVQDVNAQQISANNAVNGLQSGQGVPLHQAVIAMEEANVSFQLMIEVRNKLLESYQEVMRMSI